MRLSLTWVMITVVAMAGCSRAPARLTPAASQTVPPSPTPTRRVLEIPHGSPAEIDGTLEEGEWDDALQTLMSDGSLLLLKFAEGSLYLAVDAPRGGVINVGLLRGEALHILHSSAALGSAVYEAGSGGWMMIKDFTWCCRVSSPEAHREALFAEEGWLSHNQYAGDENHTEYQIVTPENEIKLSVTLLYRDQSGTAHWPVDLKETDLLVFASDPSVGDAAVFSDQDWMWLTVRD